MDFPAIDRERGEQVLAGLRKEVERLTAEISLFESGTVAFVERPGGRRTTVNEYTLRRLYRDRDAFSGMIAGIESLLDAQQP